MCDLPPQVRRLRGGGLPPARGGSGRVGLSSSPRRPFFVERDFSPNSWEKYFTDKKDIILDGGDRFRVYFRDPILGDDEKNVDIETLPVLVLLHGGGFSGLTWSLFVKLVTDYCYIRTLAIDLRGHGSTQTIDCDEVLSVGNFVHDIDRVLLKLYGAETTDNMPTFILMGHSMGGAIAAHYVDKCSIESITNSIIGLVVIDVVEGTAKEALSQMQQVLRCRPAGFKSIQYAIEWYVRSGQVKNFEAAKISMPGQIKNAETGICAADIEWSTQTENDDDQQSTNVSNTINMGGLSTLTESADSTETPQHSTIDTVEKATSQMISPSSTTPNTEKLTAKHPFVWRINLSNTEQYWNEWFDNLSNIFLGPKGGAKLLLLAGVDRLDGPLTVGQMQGKFQMRILPRVGHTIHEDDPDSVAHVVAEYLVRNRFTVARCELEHTFPSC